MSKLMPSPTFTPARLRLVGISLAVLAMALVVVPTLYVYFAEHVRITLANLFFPGASFALGLAALILWTVDYPRTEQPNAHHNNEPASRHIVPNKSAHSISESPTYTIANKEPILTQPYTPASMIPSVELSSTQDMALSPTLPINNPAFPYSPPTTVPPAQMSPVDDMPTQELPIQEIPTLRPVREPALKLFEFVFPKEGWKPENSQDKYAYSYQGDQCRYAVADGVGSSFLPNEWAQILTNHFVTRDTDFKGSEDFVPWLIACSQQWYRWVDEQWIPIVQQRLNQSMDWSRDRAKGAQATFIGCSLSTLPLAQRQPVQIHVMAVGDAVFFHLRPPRYPQEIWQYMSFPCTDPDEFGPIPNTLATRSDLIELAWPSSQRTIVTADPGDIILLATDALAKWILTQVQRVEPPWAELLAIQDRAAFGEFVLRELNKGTLELDDMTLLVVYLQ